MGAIGFLLFTLINTERILNDHVRVLFLCYFYELVERAFSSILLFFINYSLELTIGETLAGITKYNTGIVLNVYIYILYRFVGFWRKL
jgi:hypothetical protein